MKIQRIKFYNGIKCGKYEYNFIDINGKNDTMQLRLKGNLIQVTDTRDLSTTYTSMFNTVWFEPESTFEEFES